MKKILFFEVLSEQGSWRGSYSIELDMKKGVPSALEQALYNAKTHGGTVHSVDEDGVRNLIWPPKQ